VRAAGDAGRGSTLSLAQCGSHCRTVVAVCSHVASASDAAVYSSMASPVTDLGHERSGRLPEM
jgi:hypothetical protein